MSSRRAKPPRPAPKLRRLDLACGQRKQPGFEGVDIAPLEGVDVVHDLNRLPWPVENASVEEVHCSHFVEHVDSLITFMEELARILVTGAKATLIMPYYTSMRAWQDPTHKRALSEASFLYFNKGWRTQNGLDHYPIACDFDFSYAYAFQPEWAMRAQEARDFALKHYWNVASDLHVYLTKR